MQQKELIERATKEGKLIASASENLLGWLSGNTSPDWAVKAIEELIEQEAWQELNDRFFKYIAFGTGGMRARTIGRIQAPSEKGQLNSTETPEHPAVGTSYLNDFNVIRATIGLYRYCANYLEQNGNHFEVPKLVIAHDVRHFSRHFCELCASTWNQLGGRALIFAGARSTPQLSFTVRYTKALAGIVITASHNPPHDNGYKVYFHDGAQVTPPHDKGIINEVNQVALAETNFYLQKRLEDVFVLPETVENAYADLMTRQVIDKDLIRKHKPEVVFTSIHGTGHTQGIPALASVGIEAIQPAEQNKEDPRFPTVASPNPENAEAMKIAIELAEERGADIVLATDPDGDRMGIAYRGNDGSYYLLSGNQIGSVLAEYRLSRLKKLGWLPDEGHPNAILIKTFVTTPLQEAIAKAHGITCIQTLTGFKWIGSKLYKYEQKLKETLMQEKEMAIDYDATPVESRFRLLLDNSHAYVFGGEESYGYLATDALRDKDANAAAVMFSELAAYLKSQEKTFEDYLNDLYIKYGYYHEDLLNIYYEGAEGVARIGNILRSYREAPPTQIGDFEVQQVTDFGKQDIHDADGDLVPKEDFYFLELANAFQVAVRGSGTEPKIKFYLFAHNKVSSASELSEIKQKTAQELTALKKQLEIDAHQRAESPS